MSASSKWLVPVLALMVTGGMPAQEKAAPKQKVLPVPLRFDLTPKRIVLTPQIQIRPWMRRPHAVTAPRPNPLLKGDYSAAIGRFDTTRANVYATNDLKPARKLLDELDRTLLDIRAALWKLEKAAKAAKAERMSPTWTFPRMTPVPMNVPWNGQLIMANAWTNPAGCIRVGNRMVVHNGANRFLVGDYRKAIDALHESCGKLASEVDPTAARKIVDVMTRQILDARGALWNRERAKKARK